ncbi:ATP-binding protein [Bacillus cereus]|nr:ATP-binding protein [Bacillus cereus]
MSQFSNEIANLRYKAQNRMELEAKIEQLREEYVKMYKKYETMLRAQQVLATLSDSNSKRVLGYIQGIINKALRTMFPNETYNIIVEKKLHSNTNTHINITLTEVTPSGEHLPLDFSLQSGDGMSQVVSFLFTLCLMKIREARPIIILDEVLKGFHPDALPIVRNIIEIFAKGGFQFVLVEYDFHELGKEYLVTKKNGISTLSILDREVDVQFSEVGEREGQTTSAQDEVRGMMSSSAN